MAKILDRFGQEIKSGCYIKCMSRRGFHDTYQIYKVFQTKDGALGIYDLEDNWKKLDWQNASVREIYLKPANY